MKCLAMRTRPFLALWIGLCFWGTPAWAFFPQYDPSPFWNSLKDTDFEKGDLLVHTALNKHHEELLQRAVKLGERAEKPEVFEFKKVNFNKYRLVVHHVGSPFLVVFSEGFHDKWRLYPTDIVNTMPPADQFLARYRPWELNQGFAASKEDLKVLVESGDISTLGKGGLLKVDPQKYLSGVYQGMDPEIQTYQVAHVTKKIGNSIQNDNLPDGSFWETWFLPALDNAKSHFLVNGYANGWIVDPEVVRQVSPQSVTLGPDGKYRIELVIQYFNQIYYYIGAGISLLTLLISLFYISYRSFRQRLTADS